MLIPSYQACAICLCRCTRYYNNILSTLNVHTAHNIWYFYNTHHTLLCPTYRNQINESITLQSLINYLITDYTNNINNIKYTIILYTYYFTYKFINYINQLFEIDQMAMVIF